MGWITEFFARRTYKRKTIDNLRHIFSPLGPEAYKPAIGVAFGSNASGAILDGYGKLSPFDNACILTGIALAKSIDTLNDGQRKLLLFAIESSNREHYLYAKLLEIVAICTSLGASKQYVQSIVYSTYAAASGVTGVDRDNYVGKMMIDNILDDIYHKKG